MAEPVFKTKKDLVIEILREAIVSGELEPGERLLQDRLAERLNVSATPIREALRELQAEGVLSHTPHQGVRVSEVKLEEAQEIYMIRGLLEQLATCLAVPRLGSSDVQALTAQLARMDAYIERGELTQIRLPDYRFHMLIYRAAGMPHLLRIITDLWTRFPSDALYVLPGRPRSSVKEHRGIMQAIEDGDAVLAAQRMQDHIGHAAKLLAEHFGSEQIAATDVVDDK